MITRILLDTCAVRNFLHPVGSKLDLAAIGRRLWKYRISVVNGACAELFRQILEQRLDFHDWKARIVDLDSILDSRWPIFVGGRHLAALAKLQTDLTFDAKAVQPFLSAFWKLMRDASSPQDLLAGIAYTDEQGKLRRFKSDLLHVQALFASEVQTWVDYIQKMQTLHTADPGMFSSLKKTKAVVMQGLMGAKTDPPDLPKKLDALVCVQAELAHASFSGGYDPTLLGRRGDLFDLAMLHALPLPAIVVTSDKRFVNRLKNTKAVDSVQVISVEEFNQHSSNDTLETLLEHHRTAQEQTKWWGDAAYFRWIGRGSPLNDDWADWFATEPIA